ncbi:3',5'-cyclic-AMP phosphodiesterase [Pseudohongiella nitratireducens]|uniref:3',5'-cyclic-AMP phosphodiesterase n=1 Tax=Pseudohongiella nitratireducens TaxID=1768907 RepID=UPI0030EC19A1
MTQALYPQTDRQNLDNSPSGAPPHYVVQMTDPHLFGTPGRTLLGMDTVNSFQQVLSHLPADKIDHIVLTGDLAQDASAPAYEKLIAMLDPLGLPFTWLPGNHDNARLMTEIAKAHGGGIGDRVVVIGRWRLIMLDTSIPGKVHGELSDRELACLKAELEQAEKQDQFCLVCLHHNPLPGTSEWMLEIGLKNAAAFQQVLQPFRHRIAAVLFGHIHQNIDRADEDGIRYICTPSTSIQFKPHVTDFELDVLQPAYRWLELYDDGRIETGVCHLQNFELTIDMSAPGY